MDNRQLEQKIKAAYTAETPDVLDSILSDCDSLKGNVIIMTENKKAKRPLVKRFAGIAAAFLLVVAGAAGFNIHQLNNAVASTISLDVNPSIEIEVNKQERVLAVNPLNADAETVVGGMDFAGSDLEVAVNAIIGSMLTNGYITELSNSILISVNDKDPAKAAALQQKLSDEVNTLLTTDSFTGSVMSQTVTADAALRQKAEAYGITAGKAQLVQDLAAQNALYQEDQLAQLSINELNLLASVQPEKLSHVASTGTASDKAYIGAEKAKEIAANHSGVTAPSFSYAELDYDDGVMVYEVTFFAGGVEYEYEIDAITGAVIKTEKDREDDFYVHKDDVPNISFEQPAPEAGEIVNAPAVTGEYITKEEAKAIALAHAGVSEADIRDYSCELERDNGRMEYEIDFEAGKYEYSYDINAETGKIIHSEKERED